MTRSGKRDTYLTIARNRSAELEVKNSRFLCDLRRVDSEADARELVAQLRKEHWDARHHCSAFIIGPDGEVQRSSDDGEPSGTAGAPMLEVLRGAAVTDVAAVVIRWFGGTLLGAGGLVRAYGDSVRAALDAAGTLRRDLIREFAVELDHADAGRVEGELRARGVTVLDTTYATQVRLLLGAAPRDVRTLESTIASLTGGTGLLEASGERWIDRHTGPR